MTVSAEVIAQFITDSEIAIDSFSGIDSVALQTFEREILRFSGCFDPLCFLDNASDSTNSCMIQCAHRLVKMRNCQVQPVWLDTGRRRSPTPTYYHPMRQVASHASHRLALSPQRLSHLTTPTRFPSKIPPHLPVRTPSRQQQLSNFPIPQDASVHGVELCGRQETQ